MSQIVRIRKTKLKDKEMLSQALTDLGYKIRFARFQDKIRIIGMRISFVKTNEFYDMVYVNQGDLNSKNEFLNQVNQRYIYNITVTKLEQQGFSMASEQTEKDGRIHLVLRRAV